MRFFIGLTEITQFASGGDSANLPKITVDDIGKIISVSDDLKFVLTDKPESNQGIERWTEKTFKKDDVVLYNKNFYQCIADNSTSTEFVESEWEKLQEVELDEDRVNDLIKQYVGDKDELKTTEKTDLVKSINELKDLIDLPQPTAISDWESGTYKIGDLVIKDDNIWKCINPHTSDTFNEVNWINLTKDSRIGSLTDLKTDNKVTIVKAINEVIEKKAVLKEWKPGIEDKAGEYVTKDNNLYLTVLTNSDNEFNENNYVFKVGSSVPIKIFNSETDYQAFINNISDDDETICFVIDSELQDGDSDLYATNEDINSLFGETTVTTSGVKIIKFNQLGKYNEKIKEYISNIFNSTNKIMSIKGKIDNIDNFPSDANIGDVYILTTTSTMYTKIDDNGTLLDIGSSEVNLDNIYTKDEIDELLKNKITFLATLPIASELYKDITIINSTNGGIYKCVETVDDESNKTYSWTCINYTKEDLDNILVNKISFDSLQEGDNISITRNADKLIISSTTAQADIEYPSSEEIDESINEVINNVFNQ